MTGTQKTFILMAALTALFGYIGYLISGTNGLMIALAFAGLTNLFAWWNSDRMVLRMYGARAVDSQAAPELHRIVTALAGRANLPAPKIYLIESDQPNAFATGRNPARAAVAATTGLIARLTPDELAGVVAHELAHIKNRDTLLMTVTATLAGALSVLSNFAFMMGPRSSNGERRTHPLLLIVALVLAPLAAGLIQMAISRTREYEADRIGAGICGQPRALASALSKIAKTAAVVPNAAAETHPTTASLFIINPLRMGGLDSLFATHPRTEERIRRLMEMPDGSGGAGSFGSESDSFRWLDDGTSFPPASKNPWS